eukprot:1281451-Amphidinium_carterae.1
MGKYDVDDIVKRTADSVTILKRRREYDEEGNSLKRYKRRHMNADVKSEYYKRKDVRYVRRTYSPIRSTHASCPSEQQIDMM